MQKHYKCAICGKYRLKHCRPIRTPSLKEYVEKTIGRSTNEDDVTKHQFSQISSRLSSLRNSSVRSVESCLGIYRILLVKLRTGLPNSILSTLFSLTKSQIHRSIHSAKNAMMSNYVPHHLGFSHNDHETFVREHNTPLAKTLFTSNEKSAVLVLDGTYIYIQKTFNYKFQS